MLDYFLVESNPKSCFIILRNIWEIMLFPLFSDLIKWFVSYFRFVLIVVLVFFDQPWSFSHLEVVSFWTKRTDDLVLFLFFKKVECRVVCSYWLDLSFSAMFLRPTQVKWQLMVASCYRRSGENDSVLYLSWHNKKACYRLFSANLILKSRLIQHWNSQTLSCPWFTCSSA